MTQFRQLYFILFTMYLHRPMYIASSDDNYPDGHLPVAAELRNAIEPLLKVHHGMSLVYSDLSLNDDTMSCGFYRNTQWMLLCGPTTTPTRGPALSIRRCALPTAMLQCTLS